MKKSLLILGITATSLLAETIRPITFPLIRAGSESVALGETGVGFSSSLESHCYNPANSALFGTKRKVKTALSGGTERVMPNVYDNSRLYNTTAAYFTPIADSLFNMALLFSAEILPYEAAHQRYFNIVVDNVALYNQAIEIAEDSRIDQFKWGVSLAWKNYLSLGAECRYLKNEFSFRSDTTKYPDVDYSSSYLSWNTGLRGQYQFDLSEKFFIKPSLGISMLGLSRDSVEMESGTAENAYKYPVYSSLLFGGAVTFGNEDVIWGSLIYDNNRDLDKSGWYTNSFGFQMGVTPALNLNMGILRDSENDGGREEFHWGATLGYRSLQMNRFYRKTGKSRYIDTDLKNVELLYSFSVISPMNNNRSRVGQYSHQLTLLLDFGKSRSSEVKLSDTEMELGIEE